MSKFGTAMAALFVASMFHSPCFAQSADEAAFRKAYDSATELQKEARSYHDGWTVTTVALQSAKKAADKHDFGAAVEFAQQAEALARASVEQSKSQKKVWQDAIVR